MADDLGVVGLGLCFEDLPVGRRFRTVGRTVTDADITLFVGVTGMTEVLFTNLDYLANESLIKGRLAPGALVYSFAEGLLLQSTMQHTGLAFLGMELKVERPVLAVDLADHLQIVLEDPTPLTEGWDIGVLSSGTWRVSGQDAKHALILAGLGWGRLPLWAIERDLAEARLVRLEVAALGQQGGRPGGFSGASDRRAYRSRRKSAAAGAASWSGSSLSSHRILNLSVFRGHNRAQFVRGVRQLFDSNSACRHRPCRALENA